MYAVHIGLDRTTQEYASLLGVLRTAGHLGQFARRVYVDGDGWNVWGEAPGTDANDANTLLVTTTAPSLGLAIVLADEIVRVYGKYLVPSTSDAIAAVSDGDEFSHQHYVITAEHGRRTLANEIRQGD